MKKYIILIALSVAALTACTSTKLASVSDNERGEISWNAFCEARGYDRDALGYTFVVKEHKDGTAKWRKTTYKSLAHARRAINRWAEGGIEKIK